MRDFFVFFADFAHDEGRSFFFLFVVEERKRPACRPEASERSDASFVENYVKQQIPLPEPTGLHAGCKNLRGSIRT